MKRKKRHVNWESVYTLPLFYDDCGKVFTKEFYMAFDFCSPYRLNDEEHTVSEEYQRKVVACINGGTKPTIPLELTYVDSYIYIKINGRVKKFISIRGWGNLTSPGGWNLTDKHAVQLQDEFATFIINQLTK